MKQKTIIENALDVIKPKKGKLKFTPPDKNS